MEESENKMDDQLVPFAIEIIKFFSYIFLIFIILGEVFNVNFNWINYRTWNWRYKAQWAF